MFTGDLTTDKGADAVINAVSETLIGRSVDILVNSYGTADAGRKAIATTGWMAARWTFYRDASALTDRR